MIKLKQEEKMRSFNYSKQLKSLLKPEIVSLLTQIHEFKGEQGAFLNVSQDTLDSLLEIAKIQSTEASNMIEGIFTTDERLKKIVQSKTMPKNRNEQEIAGYRDVLATIHENYEFIPPKPSFILQLHRDLYKFSGKSIGGNYKTADNTIAEEDAQGTRFVRFSPASAWETPELMYELCKAFEDAKNTAEIDELLLIPMFILDFLCIHPFSDGNGRMSRLLTLLLLYRAGYLVGKYISIEKLIADSKETYYEVLQESSAGWHDETNDYFYFVNYILGIVVAAYREFSRRAALLVDKNVSKPDRIQDIIKNTLGPITKTEIMQQCQDISQITIQRALIDLVKNNVIKKIGGGRYTKYIWNHEQE